MHTDCDIAIVGGGPVGAALGLALNGTGLRITLLDARHEGSREKTALTRPNTRPIAVAHGSRQLLERLGAWGQLAGTPIHHVHVSQRGGLGRIAMSANEAGVPALGYVTGYLDIFDALHDTARHAGITTIDGAKATRISTTGNTIQLVYNHAGADQTLTTTLAILADGGDIEGIAPPKSVAYAQSAITACVQTSMTDGKTGNDCNTAYERFTPDGPIALLPFGKGPGDFALVWTVPDIRAPALMQFSDADFLRALSVAFGTRVGKFTSVTQRREYPLHLRYHTRAPAPGIIAIGNAAQTLHPVAGQGFNLGLRDAWELAQLIRADVQRGVDIHASELARRYYAQRRVDRGTTIAATHGLIKLFTNDYLPTLRGAGMSLLAAVPPLKNLFAQQMTFGHRR